MSNIKNMITNPRAAAIIGLLLALPLTLILSIAFFEIEPYQSFLKRLFMEADNSRNSTFGIVFFIGSLLLLPVALIINLVPVIRSVRARNSVVENPVNVLLAVAVFFFLTSLVASFVIDQYPCWVGVPNCD